MRVAAEYVNAPTRLAFGGKQIMYPLILLKVTFLSIPVDIGKCLIWTWSTLLSVNQPKNCKYFPMIVLDWTCQVKNLTILVPFKVSAL